MTILVVRTDKLGDFITALPVMYVLKKYNPKNKIIACVAPLNEDLANACDFIDEIIVDRNQPMLEFASDLRRKKIDASITLFSTTRVAAAQFLAGIAKRIAPATKLAQIFYNRRVVQRRSEVKMAEFEYNLALARELFPSIELRYPQPLIQFDRDDVAKSYRDFTRQYGIVKPVIAFHPGFGGSSDANWTLDEYMQLVEIASDNEEVQAVMTFGPGEEELYEKAVEKAAGLNVVFYQSKQGIVEFAKLLASFELFVSTSTGTYHLAALVGTPTMTFFADSLFASVKRWKAVSEERLQHPYMLPEDATKRMECFKQVRRDLTGLIAK